MGRAGRPRGGRPHRAGEPGGLGLGLVDLVLLLEEAGRVALPEPLVETTALAAPLLAELLAGESWPGRSRGPHRSRRRGRGQWG